MNDELLDRVTRLERQLMRLKFSGAGGLLLVAVGFALMQREVRETSAAKQEAGKIIAHEFILLDGAGKRCGKWTVIDGEPVLEMGERKVTPSLLLKPRGLRIANALDQDILLLGQGRRLTEDEILGIKDPWARAVVGELGADPFLTFFDDSGLPTLSLTGRQSDRGLMAVDWDGDPLAGRQRGSGFWLRLTNGRPCLELFEGDHRTRAVLGVTTLTHQMSGSETVTPAASLVLFGKDGRVIYQAGE